MRSAHRHRFSTVAAVAVAVASALCGAIATPAGASIDEYVPPGLVHLMGADDAGQLGNGVPQVSSSVPVTPLRDPLINAKDVSVSLDHTLVVQTGGRVMAFGNNDVGQLGLGVEGGSRARPVLVPGLTDVVAVEAGIRSSLALTRSGQVYAWGENTTGQLGLGDLVNRSVPTLVAGLPPVAEVSTDYVHVLARGVDGRVWAWGLNINWQVDGGPSAGGSDADVIPTPTPVPAIPDATRVFAGPYHSFAVRKDGSLWAWGSNEWGNLCIGGTTNPNKVAPTRTEFTGRVRDLDAYAVTAIVAWNGQVRTCGSTSYNELGRSFAPGARWALHPGNVPGIDNAKEVAVSYSAVFVRRWDNTVWAWGTAFEGEMGGVSSSPEPVQIPQITATHLDVFGSTVAWITPPPAG